MVQNIGSVKIIYHKSKYSQKIVLNRKTAAKLKKLAIHGGTPQNFRDFDAKL